MVNDFDNAVQADPVTLAELYKIKLKDGTEYRFTSWDYSVEFDDQSGSGDQVYSAIPIKRDTQEQESGLRINTMRVTIDLGDKTKSVVEVNEIRHNRILDYSELLLYQVDITNTENFRIKFSGNAGLVKVNRLNIEAEYRDVFFLMMKNVPVEIYGESCNWVFGGSECGVDIDAEKHTGQAQSGSDRDTINDSTLTQDDGWFDRGYVRALTGVNAGQERPIRSYVTGTIQLTIPFDNDFDVADDYEAIPFCQKTKTGCNKFPKPNAPFTTVNNYDTYGGFEFIPRPEEVH